MSATNFSTVDTGLTHTVALNASGQVFTWGFDNSANQLGRGNTANVPGQITTWRNTAGSAIATPTITKAVAGDNFGLALSSTGQVFWWGTIGASTEATPRQLALASQHVGRDIAAGGGHALMVTERTVGGFLARLYAWGNNSDGQCGVAGGGTVATPTEVTGATIVAALPVAIAAGAKHSVMIQAAGTAQAFGDNAFGQLGIGNNSDTSTPTTVVDSTNVAITGLSAVSAGFDTSVFIRGGQIATAGNNSFGQAGRTGVLNRVVEIAGPTNVNKISAGFLFNMATDASGTLYSWGFLVKREQASEVRATPMMQPGFSSISAIEAGNRQIATTGPWDGFTTNGGGDSYVVALGTTPLVSGRAIINPVNNKAVASLEGGSAGTLRITIDQPAGVGGLNLGIDCASGAVSFSTYALTVPEGETMVDVPFTTTSVAARENIPYSITQGSTWSDPRTLVLRGVNVGSIDFENLTDPNMNVLKGGMVGQITMTLNYPAPAGGVNVAYASDNEGRIASGFVFVAEGETTGTAMISTAPVTVKETVKLKVTNDGPAKAINVVVAPAAVKKLILSQGEVVGGTGVILTVQLDSVAPFSGIFVQLSSSDTGLANLPNNLLVKPGQTTVPVTTSSTPGRVSVFFTSTLDSKTRTVRLILKP